MEVQVDVVINAPKNEVWKLVSDIENAASTISGIDKLEVLERPDQGLVGLKWRETRTLFGKTATETMWITEVGEGSYYLTEARSHGSIYRTKVSVSEEGSSTRLSMVFSAQAQSFVAKVFSVLLGFMMKNAMRKAILQDLTDVKAAAEAGKGR